MTTASKLRSLLLCAPLLLPGVVRTQGLPPVPAPPQNPITPTKAVLGKMLFWDEQLSSDNTVSCGTCHRFDSGGADPRVARHPGLDNTYNTPDDVFGSPGVIRSDASAKYKPDAVFGLDVQVTRRSAQSVIGAAWALELFWDGRASFAFTDPETNRVSIPFGGALESQVVGPPVDGVEMAHEARDWKQIAQKLGAVRPLALATRLPADVTAALAANATYPALFQVAFGDNKITSERIAFAIATYERTLVPNQTPFDLNTLTPSQRMGSQLFATKGGCSSVECHEPPFFTDHQFRNTGVRPVAEDTGRMAVTNLSSDRGRFKTPPLRNVALKPRFFHNGQLTTLEEVVDFYNRGGDSNDNKDARVRPLGLAPMERMHIVDFLRNGLLDPRVAAQTAPFDRPTLYSERNPPGSNLYGADSAGAGGVTPLLLGAVPANLPNPDFKVGIARALGGAPGFLMLATRAANMNVNGIPINIDFGFVLPVVIPLSGSGAGAGHGTVQLGTPPDVALRGAFLFGQWFVPDGAAMGGIAATKGVRYSLF